MNKKLWIKLRRGILEPKHRKTIGARIWLYLHILDTADWDTGEIENWRDRDAARALEMPERTITAQRQSLEAAGYIQCRQGLHCQVIAVVNWIDPRERLQPQNDTEQAPDHGDINRVPCKGSGSHGDINRVPLNVHGTKKRVPYGLSKPRTIYLNKHLSTKNLPGKKTPGRGRKPPEASGKKAEYDVRVLERLERAFADARGCDLPDWSKKGAPARIQNTWRKPIQTILEKCRGDPDRAETVIRAVVAHMVKNKLTFSMPGQIVNTAESYIIDINKNGNAYDGYTPG